MKNATRFMAVLLFVLTSFAVPASAAKSLEVPLMQITNVQPPTERAQLEARLEEIRATDLSGKTRAEKKELRKEKHDMKKGLRRLDDGVYISAGSLILILILLIILL